MLRKLSAFCLLAVLALALSGCSAMQVGLSKKDMDVQTEMSESIFMDLANQKSRSVYVDVRDTSGQAFSLQDAVSAAIGARGYEIAASPHGAGYVLQVNVLSCSKTDKSAIEETMGAGYSGTIATGMVAGALIGTATRSAVGVATGAAVGALAGGALELLSGSLVKDVTYALVTDVQLTENLAHGQKVHRTRAASWANKVNLKFEDARPALEGALAASLAGIF